jgi:hypothetical protein
MNPMHECRGLCLASASTRNPLPDHALASRTDTSGQHDKLPVLHQNLPEQERCSTTNILPECGFSLRTSSVQLERYLVSEPSLSTEVKCLSLQAQSSTSVQNSQEKKGGARMACYARGTSSPWL